MAQPGNFLRRVQEKMYGRQRAWITPKVSSIYGDILSHWNQRDFIQRFQAYWNPFPSVDAEKFLDVNVWLRETIYRYVWLKFDRLAPPCRILDIGCGTGYFLEVCRHFGHDAVGIDLDAEPLYNDMIDFFGLERIIHRIEPMRDLPRFDVPFDVITAFLITFDELPDGAKWGEAEWDHFLSNLRGRLADKGRLVLQFNADPATGDYCTSAVKRAIRSHSAFKSRFFLEFACLEAL